MDKFDVGHPVTSLSWSLSYDRLAIGTKKGFIFVADPSLKLTSSTLVSGHHYSDVIGIDVMGDGLEYSVVSNLERMMYLL